MVQAGKMMWEEKVKRTEMSLFQEEFVRRGLRLVHDAPDQVTLGTRTQVPTRHMLDTLGVQTTSDSNVPSGQKLGLLKMYP